MNMKVVIVWAFAVIVLLGVGLFGYFNQDLLLLKEETYVPTPVSQATIRTCKLTSDAFESVYSFTIKDAVINNVMISYTTKSTDLEGYEAANLIVGEISNKTLNGINSPGMQGSTSDYSIRIQFNPKEYDKVRVEELTSEFSKLKMVIDSINNYDTYKQALSNLDSLYVCE